MSKKMKNLKWENVVLEDFGGASSAEKFDGFIGLEECRDYGLTSAPKKSRKNKAPKRKPDKSKVSEESQPLKRAKLQNGFLVEHCINNTKPFQANEDNKSTQNVVVKKDLKTKQKMRLGDKVDADEALTVEDMTSWLQFQIPEEILKGLAEQGFKRPTKIQELTLPSAMLGRRDILGAAETGSGKTLAFGIPIIAGIMKMKELEQAGEDVYEIAYKKTSMKKKNVEIVKDKKKTKHKTKKPEPEDGYSSASEEDNSEESEEDSEDEIEVPIKRDEKGSTDEGNDSDDSENYVHLSELHDSSDDASNNDEDGSDNDEDESNNDEDESDNDEDGSDNDEDGSADGDVSDDNQGIGCVKVVDDIELPGHIVTKTGKPLYALILTPTRELAIQISRHLIAAAKYTGIKVAVIVGGMAHVKQERVLSKGPEIVVATPGRLWELIQQGQPHLLQLDNIKFLAIDETDRMVERNHFTELNPLLERLNADEGRKCSRQNFVFSATLTLVHDLPSHMKGKKVTKNGKVLNRKVQKMSPQQKVNKLVAMLGMTDPKVVDITTQNLGTADTLTECRIVCSLEHKDYYLFYILKTHPGRTIVFCNSIGCVRRLAQLFGILKCRPLPLHASMPQRQRLKNLERFRDDPHGVLIATDVAARGLDIPNVDHVLHYQVPRTAENYVHRSGRTARATKEGLTILMMEPGEAHFYNKLCRTLNKTAELPTFPVHAHTLSCMKDAVNLARELDKLELQNRREAQESGWLEKAAKEMDMLVDEDFIDIKSKDKTAAKALQIKRKQLDGLLSKPILPKGFSSKFPTLNDNLVKHTDKNALDTMKEALETGSLKKEKRQSKNSSLLKLTKSKKSFKRRK